MLASSNYAKNMLAQRMIYCDQIYSPSKRDFPFLTAVVTWHSFGNRILNYQSNNRIVR